MSHSRIVQISLQKRIVPLLLVRKTIYPNSETFNQNYLLGMLAVCIKFLQAEIYPPTSAPVTLTRKLYPPPPSQNQHKQKSAELLYRALPELMIFVLTDFTRFIPQLDWTAGDEPLKSHFQGYCSVTLLGFCNPRFKHVQFFAIR